MGYKTIKPLIYDSFECKADKCEHTCCQGWEIDIDKNTLEIYDNLSGELGDKIRSNIAETSEGYSFKLTKDARCPMLDANGLCEIIKQKSEDYICDICDLHPRFFEDIDEIELMGTGLSCEKTCELLEACDELLFNCSESLVEEGEITIDTATISFEDVVSHIGLNLDKSDSVFMSTSHEYNKKILDLMEQTEPIDDKWPEQIKYLKKRLSDITAEEKVVFESNTDNYYEKIYQYILYRQFERIAFCSKKDEKNSIIRYVIMSTCFIKLWDVFDGRDIEHVRRWSEQIEYSTENVEYLIANK